MRTNERDYDGNEILRITNNRNFTYNGRKYHVENLTKADIEENKKYYLIEYTKDGYGHPLHENISWDMPKFATIKEARRFVRDWDWTLEYLV